MTGERITWDNIEGLTDQERELGKRAFAIDDLSTVTLAGNTVDGVRLPDIINGEVRR